MQLQQINIINFRSISRLSVPLSALADGSRTVGLIGMNEAGKSSVLKAIASIDGDVPILAKDFRDKAKRVEVTLIYDLSAEEFSALLAHIATVSAIEKPEDFVVGVARICFATAMPGLKKLHFVGLEQVQPLDPDEKIKWFPVSVVPQGLRHKAIFWTAASNYLIDKPIELTAFAADPTGVSIPLRNCFLLAGVEDIPARIASLEGDSTEIELLSRELGEKVTEHLSQAWPNHPVQITFLITGNSLNFHVRDLDTQGKSKTADQRSDGFRQFVSFLLTVSAQNKNEELARTIVLLDEPETHLHPLAQEYLLRELVKLTSNNRNNAVLFATHSNYLIDKSDLSRNFRVSKVGDQSKLSPFDKKSSSYASVSYEVFSIPSTDYHNELYGMLHERFQNEDPKDDTRERIKEFDEKFLHQKHGLKRTHPYKGKPKEATLSTYVRNCIHHPESGLKYTEEELNGSIKALRSML
jgi:ABC-type multidrug transport system ATPase subunit